MVNSQVSWATDALLACAQAGIPVHFIRHDGTLCARVTGSAPRGNWLQLQSLLAEFIELRDGTVRYKDWVQAQCQQARLQCARTVEQGPWSLAELPDRLQQQTQRYARKADIKRFDEQLRTLIKVHVEQQLLHLCIDADAVNLSLQNIHLINDLADILWWSQQAKKLVCLRQTFARHKKHHSGLARLDWSNSIYFIENRHSDLDSRCQALLRHFFAYLQEELDHHGFQ
jgi:hypothetical protein